MVRRSQNGVRYVLAAITILLLCLLCIACGEVGSRSVSRGLPAAAATQAANEPNYQGEDPRIQSYRQLIKALSNPPDDERAASELVQLANQSSSQRELVIRELISDVNRHDDLNGTHPILRDSLAYWMHVTNVFAQLNATEAVDVMIRCIHCGNELSGSLSVRPAFRALEKMGLIAVPKLSDALQKNADPYVRSQIALCLGDIGGPEAKKALRTALRTETDKDVAYHIRWGLATIAGDPSKYWNPPASKSKD